MNKIEITNSVANDNVREALQAFSARLAHDFNNLLTPLLAYPDMIARELPPDGKGIKLLRSLESAAEGAAAITRRLGDLSGALRKAKGSFDLADAVGAVLAGLQDLPSASGVRIERALTAGLNVTLSQDALSLAVGELCRNGLDALKGSGVLTVRVERQVYDAPLETVGGSVPVGVYAVVEIEDDGGGMSATVMESALEPLCSGGGNRHCGGGLGLSIAYCALRENGAYLALESEEGRGTFASVLIPLEEDPGQRTQDAAIMATETLWKLPRSGTPQILVVDDEPSIVNLFKLIIENYIQGVVVDKATNGAEALEMFRQRRYDVIVMDLHMPVMDGQTAFLEIEEVCRLKQWPMPRVVFCTGYAPRDVVKRAISEGDRHTLLNKPVRSEVLVKAVQTRLEAPGE